MRERRRFQFGLGTLLIVVTVLAFGVYVADAQRAVKYRDQASRLYPIRATYRNPGDMTQPPFAWRMLGATPLSVVMLASTATESDLADVRRMFPEANVTLLGE